MLVEVQEGGQVQEEKEVDSEKIEGLSDYQLVGVEAQIQQQLEGVEGSDMTGGVADSQR